MLAPLFKYGVLIPIIAASAETSAPTLNSSLTNESFTESLVIQPLAKYYTAFDFEFNITSTHPKGLKDSDIPHYGLLRRSLAQIIKNFDVAEMRLSFTRGQWDYSRFGEPSHQAPAPGVELMAWILSNETHDATQQWHSLTQKLSGMFCATLATASQPKVFVSPKLTFIPHSSTAKWPIKPFYAHLALESACTENLTPWLKLLPCRHYAGISALLKPHGVFDSHYSSMSLTVVPSSENGKVEALQKLTVVKPHHQAAQWDLSKLFKSRLNHACPLASKSVVSVKSPISSTCKAPSTILDPMPAGGWTCNGSVSYPVSSDLEFKLEVDSSHLSPEALFPEKLIKIQRHMVDRVGLQGAFNITITNLIDTSLDIALLQVLPWYIQPYLHTIQFDEKLDDFLFQPALDLQQASALEFKFKVPPYATQSFHIEFVAKFLTLDQYPPDPNRGFSIGPAVATVFNPHKQYSTSNLLVFLPTPDFSMPYNVATFASTVFALYFGSLVNTLTRQFKLIPKVSL